MLKTLLTPACAMALLFAGSTVVTAQNDGKTAAQSSQEEKDVVDALQLEPWQPGDKGNYIRLAPRALTGRRFKVNRPDLWNTRLNDARRSTFE